MQSDTRTPSILRAVLVSMLVFVVSEVRDTLAADASPVVKTSNGSVRGARAEGVSDVTVYRGIPFAAAPTGTLRWREPRPAAHWNGIREPLAAVEL
jgi:para-nitrobenzyl esterase